MRLYHYTCADAAPLIFSSGYVRPNNQPQLGGIALAWFTDLDWPDRDALGLTSYSLRCDRTEYRCTVDADVTRWVRFARTLPATLRRGLELAEGALPMHWWVAAASVPVLEVKRVAAIGTAS